MRPHHGARQAGLAVLVLAASLVAAGCTSGGGDPDPVPSTPSATPTTAPTDPAATPGPTTGADPTAEPGEPGEPAPDPSGEPGGAGTVEVVVTIAAWNVATQAVEVSGYAIALESDGLCTLTLTHEAGATVEVGTEAAPDATTTSCGLLSVGRDLLASGSWSGTLRYDSPNSSGSAPVEPMEIP